MVERLDVELALYDEYPFGYTTRRTSLQFNWTKRPSTRSVSRWLGLLVVVRLESNLPLGNLQQLQALEALAIPVREVHRGVDGPSPAC